MLFDTKIKMDFKTFTILVTVEILDVNKTTSCKGETSEKNIIYMIITIQFSKSITCA